MSQLENRMQETREHEGSTSPVWTLAWSMRYVARTLKKEVTDSYTVSHLNLWNSQDSRTSP